AAVTSPRPLVIAHRGASGYETENSLAAFRAAAPRGAHGVELDIHATTDGALIVHHDEVVSGRHITRSTGAEIRASRPALVETVQSAGYRVFAWTVNEDDEMRRLVALGVDGICTNYPDVARRAVVAAAG